MKPYTIITSILLLISCTLHDDYEYNDKESTWYIVNYSPLSDHLPVILN
jgi:hypothetical protein